MAVTEHQAVGGGWIDAETGGIFQKKAALTGIKKDFYVGVDKNRQTVLRLTTRPRAVIDEKADFKRSSEHLFAVSSLIGICRTPRSQAKTKLQLPLTIIIRCRKDAISLFTENPDTGIVVNNLHANRP
jgi:hypothetical protein